MAPDWRDRSDALFGVFGSLTCWRMLESGCGYKMYVDTVSLYVRGSLVGWKWAFLPLANLDSRAGQLVRRLGTVLARYSEKSTFPSTPFTHLYLVPLVDSSRVRQCSIPHKTYFIINPSNPAHPNSRNSCMYRSVTSQNKNSRTFLQSWL